MTFEKHLHSVYRAASQRLGILRKFWQVFHDKLILKEMVFLGFQYCFAVWCSAANTHLKLLDCVVSGVSFLTGGALECDVLHCRSVTVLCMLNKIRCKLMHPHYGAQPESDVLVHVT